MSNQWTLAAMNMPGHGIPVLVTNGQDIRIACWHNRMGRNGDFATITESGRSTTYDHLPGMTYWMYLPDVPRT